MSKLAVDLNTLRALPRGALTEHLLGAIAADLIAARDVEHFALEAQRIAAHGRGWNDGATGSDPCDTDFAYLLGYREARRAPRARKGS